MAAAAATSASSTTTPSRARGSRRDSAKTGAVKRGGIRFSAYNAREKGFLTPGRYIAVMALARPSIRPLPAAAPLPGRTESRRGLVLLGLAAVTPGPIAPALLRTPPPPAFPGYVGVARAALVFPAPSR